MSFGAKLFRPISQAFGVGHQAQLGMNGVNRDINLQGLQDSSVKLMNNSIDNQIKSNEHAMKMQDAQTDNKLNTMVGEFAGQVAKDGFKVSDAFKGM